MASKLTHHTATGDVTTDSVKMKSLVCTGSGAAGTVVVREGGVGGTIRATLRALSGGTVVWTAADPNGAALSGGIHLTVTTAEVTIEWED